MKDPPHSFLQLSIPMGTRGVKYHTVFYDLLINYYENYSINGATLFPYTGIIEIGLAARIKMCKKSSLYKNVFELLDIDFLIPLELKIGTEISCKHHFDSGMELS